MTLSLSPIHWPKLGVCLGAGIIIALSPRPAGLSPEGWAVFAVFCGVILAFMLRPLPMAPAVLLGLLALAFTGTVPLGDLLQNGFGNSTVWLVVAAFLVADTVEATGLGRRIALLLLKLLGRSLTGLAYAVSAAELALAPFIPSNTARGGGIMAPIVGALARTLSHDGEAGGARAAAYLVQVGSHANLITSSMFITAMAGNGLIPREVKAAYGIDFDYLRWLAGASVPGLLSLALLPLLLKVLEPPGVVNLRTVRQRVVEELEALGSWTRPEKLLAALLFGLLALWSTGKLLEPHVLLKLGDYTAVALLGVLFIVLLGIRPWSEVAASRNAWDAYLWLGGFVALAEALKTTRFTEWLGTALGEQVVGMGQVECISLLGIAYFFSMYFFSQLTAHIAALAGVFLVVAAKAGVPPLLGAAVIAYLSCLSGALSPWSSGPVIIYFQFGFVTVPRWMRNGLAIGVTHLVLWLTVGLGWWRILGWW